MELNLNSFLKSDNLDFKANEIKVNVLHQCYYWCKTDIETCFTYHYVSSDFLLKFQTNQRKLYVTLLLVSDF